MVDCFGCGLDECVGSDWLCADCREAVNKEEETVREAGFDAFYTGGAFFSCPEGCPCASVYATTSVGLDVIWKCDRCGTYWTTYEFIRGMMITAMMENYE